MGVHNEKQRIGQAAGHNGAGNLGGDFQVLALHFNGGRIKETHCPVAEPEGTLQGRFDQFRRHILAVGKLHALPDAEGPGQIVIADTPLLRQAGNQFTVLVKPEQRLANGVTGDHPAKILLCGLQGVCEAGHSDGDLTALRGAAALGLLPTGAV